MTGKEKLEAFLREQQVPFEMQRHHVAYTSQDVAISEHIPIQMMAKVAIAFADATMITLVLPASHRVDLTRLSAAIQAQHVHLASEHEIEMAFPDCEVGAIQFVPAKAPHIDKSKSTQPLSVFSAAAPIALVPPI